MDNEAEVAQADIADVPATFDRSVVLLDVREHDEWQRGHADGAKHIPMGEVPARLDEIDADTTLFVVCHAGGRSMRVSQYLMRNGYSSGTIVTSSRRFRSRSFSFAGFSILPSIVR